MKYRKKYTEIEAIQWTGDNYDEVCIFMGKRRVPIKKIDIDRKPYILDIGTELAYRDDYIIKSIIKGELGFYRCDPDIFREIYEEVD